jgi:hypothetical protein
MYRQRFKGELAVLLSSELGRFACSSQNLFLSGLPYLKSFVAIGEVIRIHRTAPRKTVRGLEFLHFLHPRRC